MANNPESLVEVDGYKVFGAPEQTVLEPMNGILVAGQMRASMNEGSQRELEDSIRKHGQDLPIVTTYAPLGLTRDYVHLTNECWGARVTIPKRIIKEGNMVTLLAAGHRRYKANLSIAKASGISVSEMAIKAFRREPKSVMDIMKIQARENLHSRPPAIQFARITQEMYSVGRQMGAYNSVGDFLADSPLKEDATRDALLFFTLPKDVQNFVDVGEITYTIALEIARYQHVLEEHNLRQFIDSIDGSDLEDSLLDQMKLLAEAVTHDEIKSFAMTIISKMRPKIEGTVVDLKKKRGWSSSVALEHIRGKVTDLKTSQQMQMDYFNSAIERATHQHRQSRQARERVIGDAAVEAVFAARHLMKAGVQIPVEAKRAAALIAKKHGVNIGIEDYQIELIAQDPSTQEQTLSLIA